MNGQGHISAALSITLLGTVVTSWHPVIGEATTGLASVQKVRQAASWARRNTVLKDLPLKETPNSMARHKFSEGKVRTGSLLVRNMVGKQCSLLQVYGSFWWQGGTKWLGSVTKKMSIQWYVLGKFRWEGTLRTSLAPSWHHVDWCDSSSGPICS